MEQEHPYITRVLACNSREALYEAAQISRTQSDLNHIIISTAISFPDGVEERVVTKHRIGDYFDNVEVITNESERLKIVFHPRQGAKRFWKDLAADILFSVRDSAGASVETMQSRLGEEERLQEIEAAKGMPI